MTSRNTDHYTIEDIQPEVGKRLEWSIENFTIVNNIYQVNLRNYKSSRTLSHIGLNHMLSADMAVAKKKHCSAIAIETAQTYIGIDGDRRE